MVVALLQVFSIFRIYPRNMSMSYDADFENGASPEWSLISIDLQTPLTVIW
jgi:hypothetical protein